MADFLQPIGLDEHVKRKINDLMAEGVRNVPEMSRHLNHYVRHELFQGRSVPDKENRRFFPTKRAIQSRMYAASVRQQFSFIDQENVEAPVEHWSLKNPQDRFFFLPHSFTEEADATGDANHLPEDDDNQKDDDAPFPLVKKKLRKRCCSFIRPRTSGTYLNAMGISCAYLTPRIKQRAMLCPCSLLQLKLTLITSQFVPS